MSAVREPSPSDELAYEILEVIEETASTTVYLARPPDADLQSSPVTLERLWTGGEFAHQNFVEVANLAARVGQPPLRRFLGLGEVDSKPCIVWEAIDGASLQALRDAHPDWVETDEWVNAVCHLVIQAAEAFQDVFVGRRFLTPTFSFSGDDLWILRDGTTRVRVLERLAADVPAGSPLGGQEGATVEGDHHSALLGACLWTLLLGETPKEIVGSGQIPELVVPPRLGNLPPALQTVLLESVSPDPHLGGITVAGLALSLKSYLRQGAGEPSQDALAGMLALEARPRWSERPPKESGVAPIVAARRDAPAEDERVEGAPSDESLPEETELEVPILVESAALDLPPAEDGPMDGPFVLPGSPSIDVARKVVPDLTPPSTPSTLIGKLPDLPELGIEERSRKRARPRSSTPPPLASQTLASDRPPAQPDRGGRSLWWPAVAGLTVALLCGAGAAYAWSSGALPFARAWLAERLPAQTDTPASPSASRQAAPALESPTLPPELSAVPAPGEDVAAGTPSESANAADRDTPAAELTQENGLPGDPAAMAFDSPGLAASDTAARELETAGTGAAPAAETATAAVESEPAVAESEPAVADPTGSATGQAATPAATPAAVEAVPAAGETTPARLRRTRVRRAQQAVRARRTAQRASQRQGTVYINTEGRWADVFDGDRYLGTTPLTVKLEAGLHRIRIRPSGYTGQHRISLRVRAGGTHQVVLPLVTHPQEK